MTTPSPKGAALITGASSGIGAVYAERLAHRGHDLVLVARDQPRLEALAQRLRAEAGVAVSVLRADLTDKAELKAVEQRLREDASIAMLVNNAGIVSESPLLTADLDRIDVMLDLNIVAASRLAVAAAQAFAARGQGAIINIASVVALIPEHFNGAYSGTKAYLLNLTQALHGELAGKGVQVQAVMPGYTRTEIFERAGLDASGLDPAMVMEAGDLVDAALVGFDQGELVTIPSLGDTADWDAAQAARFALGPNLSKNHPAPRYGVAA